VTGLSRRRFAVGAGAAGLGLLAGCGRLPWQAREPDRVPRLAWLTSPTEANSDFEAFQEGLREYGYIPGQNITVETRGVAGNDAESLRATFAALVRLPVDVIVVGSGLPAVRAAMDATATIPIILAVGGDPVEAGVVASLARPGGNVTGLTAISYQLSGKRLELLAQTVPGVGRVGVLLDAASQSKTREWQETAAAAQSLGIRLQALEVRGPEDFESAFDVMTHERVEALVVLHSSLTSAARPRIVDFAARTHLPAMYEFRDWTEAGGLMNYAPNRAVMARRAAYYVDRVLKGTSPADLPIEQPREFEFVVNMKTARVLGITFPPEIMLQVTEVIDG
jgi:putative tryptophan/tyrosine transport system substrate-binding protein